MMEPLSKTGRSRTSAGQGSAGKALNDGLERRLWTKALKDYAQAVTGYLKLNYPDDRYSSVRLASPTANW